MIRHLDLEHGWDTRMLFTFRDKICTTACTYCVSFSYLLIYHRYHSTPSINIRSKSTQRCRELLAKCNICSGLSTQHVNNTRRINNFVGAVEAATDIKKENLAIERKLAQGSAAEDIPDLEPDLAERKRSALASYLKIAVPWLLFIVILCVIAYFIISSSVAT